MSINWNMAIGPDIGSHIMNSFQAGQQQGREERGRNALAAYAMNPNEQTLGGIAPYDPKFVLEQRQAQAQKAQADLAKVAKLLEGVNDEGIYQQRLGMARNMGIDTSQAPANYDPKWVGETTAMFKLLTEKPEAISGIARELADAGYKPNTPEFQVAMRQVISNKYASEYVDEQGNTRRRSMLDLTGGGQQQTAPPPPPPSPTITAEQFRGAVNGLGPEGAASWAQRNGFTVSVATPDEASALPPGTRYVTPDGREMIR